MQRFRSTTGQTLDRIATRMGARPWQVQIGSSAAARIVPFPQVTETPTTGQTAIAAAAASNSSEPLQGWRVRIPRESLQAAINRGAISTGDVKFYSLNMIEGCLAPGSRWYVSSDGWKTSTEVKVETDTQLGAVRVEVLLTGLGIQEGAFL